MIALTQDDLNLLQDNILYIAVQFDKFCREHEIDYYLLGGTALGAIRHGGFIPWDDDFDVCMSFGDYQKFIALWPTNGHKEIYLQAECTDEWPLFFSKLRLNNSLYMENEDFGRSMHNGIYIDIMCLNNTFDNSWLRYSQYVIAKLLSASAIGRRGYNTDSFVKKCVIFFSGLIVHGPVKVLMLKYVRILNGDRPDTKFKSHFFGRAKFKNTCFQSSFLRNPRRIKFENVKFTVMGNVEEYLEARFGAQFMDNPGDDVKSQYPSHCCEFKLNTDIQGWNS